MSPLITFVLYNLIYFLKNSLSSIQDVSANENVDNFIGIFARWTCLYEYVDDDYIMSRIIVAMLNKLNIFSQMLNLNEDNVLDDRYRVL